MPANAPKSKLATPLREVHMATATEVIANETEIKQAMETLRLGEWADDVLDEIELDRRLKKSLEQFERGETMPIEEAERIMKERFASGYYGKK
jgi:CMP-N-acetylneuraminic acid synthetase